MVGNLGNRRWLSNGNVKCSCGFWKSQGCPGSRKRTILWILKRNFLPNVTIHTLPNTHFKISISKSAFWLKKVETSAHSYYTLVKPYQHSISVYFSPFNYFWSTSTLSVSFNPFDLFRSIQSILIHSVHFSPLQSIWSTLVVLLEEGL